jgi:hypothetical protein
MYWSINKGAIMPSTEGFVLVKGLKGEMIKVEDRKELEAYLRGLTPEELSNCVWDSIKEAFRVGKKVGFKQAQNPSDSYSHRDTGNHPRLTGRKPEPGVNSVE